MKSHWFLYNASGEMLCAYETVSAGTAKRARKLIAATLLPGEYLSRRFSGPHRKHNTHENARTTH